MDSVTFEGEARAANSRPNDRPATGLRKRARLRIALVRIHPRRRPNGKLTMDEQDAPTSTDYMRYDVLVNDALRGVMRKILSEIGKTGLPGEHHFYISFDTRHSGVRMSTRLRQRYPEEMTVVLQHQFWDLQVTDHAFEVGLSFGGVPERLLVPWLSIKGFFDPSVRFGLQFQPIDEAAERIEPTMGAAEPAKPGSASGQPANAAPAPAPQASGPTSVPQVSSKEKAAPKTEKPAEPAPTAANKDAEAAPTATVLSIDAFRKKP